MTDIETFYHNQSTLFTSVQIFSVIVCASITSGGFQNLPISSKLNCVLNENPAACGYAIGFGIVAGLLCLLFLLLDFFDSYIRTWFLRKSICIADFVCSVLCAALWFIGFCFLAHQWALSVPDTYPLGVGSGQNAIVFSFLSIPCWYPCISREDPYRQQHAQKVVLSYMAFMRFSSSNVDYCKHSAEVAILPIMRSLSSLSSGQIDP
ncbi:synaptogyrin-4 isoform X3 [Rhinoderma darwinii]|uniref:synaptogyrin-4 isoform X3 n=1 Tax=Rhinoderma darwinii TaxID=43563 RepID=UPI003F66F0A5